MKWIIHIICLVFTSLVLTMNHTPMVENNLKENESIKNEVVTKHNNESDQKELPKQDNSKKEVKDNSKSKSENKKSDTSNNSSTTNESKEEKTFAKIEEPKEEETKKSEEKNTNQYIGIPNPNDFYYSFHHGKIEYSNMESCLADTARISFKDTVDIINTICIDVVDGQGTVLGEYLYINCNSGNCDKYK